MTKTDDSPAIDNLSDLLPYLSEGFCNRCTTLLRTRLQNLNVNSGKLSRVSLSDSLKPETSESFWSSHSTSSCTPEKSYAASSLTTDSSPQSVSSSSSIGSKVYIQRHVDSADDPKRMAQVGRKKDFFCVEKIHGKPINVLQGLELHTRVFNDDEQKKIVDYVYNLQRMGESGKLRDRTYNQPRKWMRGKGRVTIQFGCCYNYAVDKDGNPPGILRDEEVDPIPSLFKSMIKRMVRWSILPPTCIPNSCIVNIYDEGDCIPPHIDHHDFLRPFCTVSFLTESNILFGSNLKIMAPGEFCGAASIPLPVGSVLILKGNGADVAKHCVPAVRGKRISITFRKMDDSKLPFKFSPDPELQGIHPLGSSQVNRFPVQHQQNSQQHTRPSSNGPEVVRNTSNGSLKFGESDFPPLVALNIGNRSRSKKN